MESVGNNTVAITSFTSTECRHAMEVYYKKSLCDYSGRIGHFYLLDFSTQSQMKQINVLIYRIN
jgi:hypothetical protein